MKCSNCGAELLANNNICPQCGTMNLVDAPQTPVQEAPAVPQAPVAPAAPVENVQPVAPVAPVEQTPIAPVTMDTNAQPVGTETMETLDEPNVQITEDMAPPTLLVEQENLRAGATDITSAQNVSDYAPEQAKEDAEEAAKEAKLEEEKVDIAIPSVQTPVSDVDMPTDGTAPEVVQNNNTVGEVNNVFGTSEIQEKDNLKIKLIKGSKNVPKPLLIIVAILFLVIGLLTGKTLFSKNYCATSSNSSIFNREKIKFVNDGKNNITNAGDYSYKIPSQYIYDKKDGGVYIYDKDDKFRIYIGSQYGSYDDILGGKNSIRETLRENNITVNNMKEVTSLDKDFLVFEGTTRSVNRLIAFSDAGNDHVFYAEVVTIDNVFNYDSLEIIADIFKNATYEQVESKMEQIEVNDVSQISIKAAMEYKGLTANN